MKATLNLFAAFALPMALAAFAVFVPDPPSLQAPATTHKEVRLLPVYTPAPVPPGSTATEREIVPVVDGTPQPAITVDLKSKSVELPALKPGQALAVQERGVDAQGRRSEPATVDVGKVAPVSPPMQPRAGTVEIREVTVDVPDVILPPPPPPPPPPPLPLPTETDDDAPLTVGLTPGWATFGEVLPQGAAKGLLQVGDLVTQTDVKTTWPDGSIRYAVVTCKVEEAGTYRVREVSSTPNSNH